MSYQQTGNHTHSRTPSLPMSLVLASYVSAMVAITITVLLVFFYRSAHEKLMGKIDDQLYAAAHFAKDLMPGDFHDQIQDASSITPDRYEEIVDRHNRLCKELGLQYLWSCLRSGDGIFFTTATSPDHDVQKNEHARFFDAHRDPQAFDTVFASMKPDYSSFDNEWGHGRMVLVPFRDRLGRAYCFGASICIDDVIAAQRSLLRYALILGIGVIAIGFVGTFLISCRITRRIRALIASANRITEGDLSETVPVGGPSELRQLARALDAMREAVASHITALTKTENAQHDLLENLSAGVVIHAPDTHILYSNPRACELLGLSYDQLLGKQAIDPAWSFVQENGDQLTLEEYPVSLVLASRERLTDYIVGINHPDNIERTWVLVNAFPEFIDNDEVRQIVVTFVDITALKKLESQLAQAQKMEAIGQLTGGIAHDFNNILQAINGYAQLAELDTAEKHPARDSLAEIQKAANRAGGMIAQLLAFSRRQILEPSCINLNVVLADLLGMLKHVIGEHIKLDFIPGHRLATVLADQTMIEQILLNLCVNARDAMPQGGHLTVETENVLLDQDYCTQNIWATPGRYVLTSVTDTGSGIEPEVISRIFDPFFSTKEQGAGTGLGLATVYGAVRQHDGMVRVYSEINKGTTFKIYLPVVERPADTVGTKIEGTPPRGSETILVAEDDDSLRKLARTVLTRAGYTVITAADGEKALEAFESCPGAIDLLLLDVVMPKMGGREVYDHVRKQGHDVAILFASGYSENAIHTGFVLEVGLKLIRKPYNSLELLQRVRGALDEASG
ncbi:MAG: response regulator [Verrucomicrobia bacterium]|jgi:PAS domain S-box-containing protein|nr:response regulator [Verrucomicrobiota bacterium]